MAINIPKKKKFLFCNEGKLIVTESEESKSKLEEAR